MTRLFSSVAFLTAMSFVLGCGNPVSEKTGDEALADGLTVLAAS